MRPITEETGAHKTVQEARKRIGSYLATFTRSASARALTTEHPTTYSMNDSRSPIKETFRYEQGNLHIQKIPCQVVAGLHCNINTYKSVCYMESIPGAFYHFSGIGRGIDHISFHFFFYLYFHQAGKSVRQTTDKTCITCSDNRCSFYRVEDIS